jgi:parvulin-like peptidyl-prolyl isomerase
VTYEQDSYQPSDQEVADFYAANQATWSAATIKVILLGFKPDPITGTSEEAVKQIAEQIFNAAHALNDRSQAEATKLAADLVRQLRAGADFGKLAAEYSDDKESKDEGGDFGIPIKTTSTSYRDDFKQAIFALKPGEVSDPVPQPTGFYIIRLEEKKVQPLREVSDLIKTQLKADHVLAFIADLDVRLKPKLLRPDFFTQAPAAAPPK